MTQMHLFNNSPEQFSKNAETPSIDKFEGAMLFSAIGDALGWPTEFIREAGKYKPPFELPVHNFVKWKKMVGGRWWGYDDDIEPGQYSDDTQLTLAIARCITDRGSFEPERFAYEELPLWLQYERGGGKSIKTAARKLISKNANWLKNFYRQGDIIYTNAGANGAAMRNLPIALASVNNERRIIRDSFLNSIITHGHPRAILGAILMGSAVCFTMTTNSDLALSQMIEYLIKDMRLASTISHEDDRIARWLINWEKHKSSEQRIFDQLFEETRQEATKYLASISSFVNSEPKNYYIYTGALRPETRGSGLATVCTAIYLFLKYKNQPEEALGIAVNMLGSDTDTIAAFVGALFGAYRGLSIVPKNLLNAVQDQNYLLETAHRLHRAAAGELWQQVSEDVPVNRMEAYLRILAWEIGLHEMFWDALDVGEVVFHPALGRGTITSKSVKPLRRNDYKAKLIRINFDCGQSCVFHSRVENEE